MKNHHKIISFLNNFFTFKVYKKNLRILTFHHIKEENFLSLKKKLIELKKKYVFLTPQDFINIQLNKKQLTKDSLLLTFDDGYYSQKKFADQVLKKIKIKAIFFVVPNFFKINSFLQAKKFISKNINKNLTPNQITYCMRNMTIKDIKKLKNSGHVIGIHTLSHKMLSKIRSIKKLNDEIFSKKNLFSNLIGEKNLFFAFPFGDISSINKNSLKIIKKHYKFIFSGIRGNNLLNKKNLFWRDAIEDDFDIGLIKMFLRGFVDIYYYKDRKKIISFL